MTLYWSLAPWLVTGVGAFFLFAALVNRMFRAAAFGVVVLIAWGLLLVHHFH